jgi:hypothetical protein
LNIDFFTQSLFVHHLLFSLVSEPCLCPRVCQSGGSALPSTNTCNYRCATLLILFNVLKLSNPAFPSFPHASPCLLFIVSSSRSVLIPCNLRKYLLLLPNLSFPDFVSFSSFPSLSPSSLSFSLSLSFAYSLHLLLSSLLLPLSHSHSLSSSILCHCFSFLCFSIRHSLRFSLSHFLLLSLLLFDILCGSPLSLSLSLLLSLFFSLFLCFSFLFSLLPPFLSLSLRLFTSVCQVAWAPDLLSLLSSSGSGELSLIDLRKVSFLSSSAS